MPIRFRPNVVGPFRYAFGLTALMLLCVAPMLWFLADALRSGNQGYLGAVLFWVGPGLIILPFAFWGLYSDRRKMMRSEFSEQPPSSDALETQPRADG